MRRFGAALAVALGSPVTALFSLAVAVPAHAEDYFIGCPSGHSGIATTVTSCPFAENVRQAYLSQDGMVVTAYSPVTNQYYDMQCAWFHRSSQKRPDSPVCEVRWRRQRCRDHFLIRVLICARSPLASLRWCTRQIGRWLMVRSDAARLRVDSRSSLLCLSFAILLASTVVIGLLLSESDFTARAAPMYQSTRIS